MKYKKPKEVETGHQEALIAIGRKLEELRKKRGISALKLSEEINISRNAYRQMEKGEVYFSTYNFLKVLDYHQINIQDFFKML